MRRLLVVGVLVVFGVASCGGIYLLLKHEAVVAVEPTFDCDTGTSPVVDVRSRIMVQVDGRDAARIVNDTEVHVPRSWLGATDLLSDPDHDRYRRAIRCLLGFYTGDFRVIRAHRPIVVVPPTGDIVVYDEAWIDMWQQTTLTTGVMTVERSMPGVWRVYVVAPQGLRSAASWSTDITAPAGWLASPDPWPWSGAVVSPGRVTWALSGAEIPAGDYVRAAVDLHPDIEQQVASFSGEDRGQLVAAASNFLETGAFIFVALYLVRFVRRRAVERNLDISNQCRLVRRIVLAVLAIQVVVLLLDVWSPLKNMLVLSRVDAGVIDGVTPWAADVVVGALVILVGWLWWLPRTLLLTLSVLSGGYFAAVAVLTRPWHPPTSPGVFDRAVATGDAVVAYLATALLIAAAANAVRVAARRSADQARRMPVWCWVLASASSALLVVERYLTNAGNISMQAKYDPPASQFASLATTYSYYLYNLIDGQLWLLEAVVALAAATLVFHYVTIDPEPERRTLAVLTVALLLVGPVYWTYPVAGFSVPLWLPIGATAAVLLGASRPILSRPTRRGPLISTYAANHGLDAIRMLAVRWIRGRVNDGGSPSGTGDPGRNPAPGFPGRITPLDVVVAFGPGSTPVENVRYALRLVRTPALIGGGGYLLTMWWKSYGFESGYPASIVLDHLYDLIWEVVKWIVTAVLVGVAWTVLPGRRGPLKVLPLVAAYEVGPMVTFGVPFLWGGWYTWLDVVDAAVYAAVLIVLGARMDAATLRELTSDGEISRRQLFVGYGIGSLASRVSIVLAPVTAVVALVGSLLASPVAPSNTTGRTPPTAAVSSNAPGG